MSEIIIREAKIEDAKAIVELSLQMGSHALSENETRTMIAKFYNQKNEVIFVAEKESQILGYVSIYCNFEILTGPQARIDVIVVDENTRGLGIGRKLMAQAEEWAKEQGSQTMKLASNAKRTDSHTFYEKIGYEKTKEQFQFKKELL